MTTNLDDPTLWKEFNDEMDELEGTIPKHVLDEEIDNILEIVGCFYDGAKVYTALEILKKRIYKRMRWQQW